MLFSSNLVSIGVHSGSTTLWQSTHPASHAAFTAKIEGGIHVPDGDYYVVFWGNGGATAWAGFVNSTSPITVGADSSGSTAFLLLPSPAGANSTTFIGLDTTQATAHYAENSTTNFTVAGQLTGYAGMSAREWNGTYTLSGPGHTVACPCWIPDQPSPGSIEAPYGAGNYQILRSGWEAADYPSGFFLNAADFTFPT
ncbi:MAG: hypothetical protein WDA16_04275 [Candidatus Thermoplasmatota archaeon]